MEGDRIARFASASKAVSCRGLTYLTAGVKSPRERGRHWFTGVALCGHFEPVLWRWHWRIGWVSLCELRQFPCSLYSPAGTTVQHSLVSACITAAPVNPCACNVSGAGETAPMYGALRALRVGAACGLEQG